MFDLLSILDWSSMLVLVGISFGSQKQSDTGSSSSSSNQGLLEPQKSNLSSYIQPLATNQFGPYLQQMLDTPYALPTLNSAGVYDTQNAAVNGLLQQNVGQASSNLAQRGFNNAAQTPLAATQGLQNFLPQYLDTVGQNIQQQLIAPETVRQQRFSDAANAFQQLIALLGGQSGSTTTGSQSGGGFNFGLG